MSTEIVLITFGAKNSNENIALIKHKDDKIIFYELNDSNELEITNSAEASSFKNINFSCVYICYFCCGIFDCFTYK